MRFFELIRPDDAAPDQDFGPIPSLRHGCTLSRIVVAPPRDGTGKTGLRSRRAKAGSPYQRSLCSMKGEKVCGLTSITRDDRPCDF